MHFRAFTATALAAIAPVSLAAQTSTQQDTAAITAIVNALSDAWNHGDAHAFAAHYDADGSFTNILGTTLFGREPFEQQHQKIFTTIYKGSTVTFTPDRIKSLRPDVALVDITSHLSGAASFAPGIKPSPDGSLLTRLQLVLTRESGVWWIAAFHNVTVIPLPPRP